MHCIKRFALLVLAAFLAAPLGGCGRKESVDIALILAIPDGLSGDSFYQSSWSGVEQCAGENGLQGAFYVPTGRNQEAYGKLVDQAVEEGARLLVFPGFLLEGVVYEKQEQYPEVGFLLLDGVPNNGLEGAEYREEVAPNTVAVQYAEEQAGFLAGYAAVQDGFRNLGFFGGMSVPAVVRFGHGYVQGAEYAAQQLGLGESEVEIRYLYCGSFSASPEHQAKAARWYHQGTEVIFACGGAVSDSIFAAAELSDAWAIGVDADQSADSERVLTSAIKRVDLSVYTAATAYFAGNYAGGALQNLSAEQGGVGLAMDTSRFRTFGKDDYDAVLADLSAGKISVLRDDVDILDISVSCVDLVLG